MSTTVSIALIHKAPPELDDMVELKQLCDKLKAEYPERLKRFFAGTEALDVTENYDIKRLYYEHPTNSVPGCAEGNMERDGSVTIDLTKLPDSVTGIRVHYS